jgi:hypothetical protein
MAASPRPLHGEPGAGYSGTPLPRKLGIEPGHLVGLAGAPPGFAGRLGELPDVEITGGLGELPGRQITEAAPAHAPAFDVIVFFVTWRAELEAGLGRLRQRMAPACGLWVSWPKRAARVPTDMTDQVVRDVALPTGLVDNKVCAIDGTWSALRLVIRRELR